MGQIRTPNQGGVRRRTDRKTPSQGGVRRRTDRETPNQGGLRRRTDTKRKQRVARTRGALLRDVTPKGVLPLAGCQARATLECA